VGISGGEEVFQLHSKGFYIRRGGEELIGEEIHTKQEEPDGLPNEGRR